MPINCGCVQCVAANRLRAMAVVFEEAGNYAAADCCDEWAKQAGEPTQWGQRMALAIVYGTVG